MFEGYFGSGGTIRASMIRDDTCTVMAEFGNEYTDNGFEKFVEKEKYHLRRDEKKYPIWRGTSHNPLGKKTKFQNEKEKELAEIYESLHDTPPPPTHRESKLQRTAENYLKAEKTRKLFDSQRDREAHDRDLEFMDTSNVEYLPDGTKIRHEKMRGRSQSTVEHNLSRAASMRVLHEDKKLPSWRQKIHGKKLTLSEQLLLRDYLAPPTATNLLAAGGEDSTHLHHNNVDPALAHHPKREDGFWCTTEDDDGCPVDASLGTVALFRQIRRWRKFVPKKSNFSHKSINPPLRLDLPLQDEARSFETLMNTQMEDQTRQLREDEERRQAALLASRSSTPAYFDGDGEGAVCCTWGPIALDVDDDSNSSDDDGDGGENNNNSPQPNRPSQKRKENKNINNTGKDQKEKEEEESSPWEELPSYSPERVAAAQKRCRHLRKAEHKRRHYNNDYYYPDDNKPIENPTREVRKKQFELEMQQRSPQRGQYVASCIGDKEVSASPALLKEKGRPWENMKSPMSTFPMVASTTTMIPQRPPGSARSTNTNANNNESNSFFITQQQASYSPSANNTRPSSARTVTTTAATGVAGGDVVSAAAARRYGLNSASSARSVNVSNAANSKASIGNFRGTFGPAPPVKRIGGGSGNTAPRPTFTNANNQQQQQQQQRPMSARTNNNVSYSLDSTEKQYPKRQLRKPDARFQTIVVDPRFTKPTIGTVGQRMLTSDMTEFRE